MTKNKTTDCPVCRATTVNTYAISCCKCEKWSHIKCISMNVATLNLYDRELKLADGKRWFCKGCTQNVQKRTSIGAPNTAPNSTPKKDFTLADIMMKLESMENKYSEVFSRLDEQKKINSELKAEINELRAKLINSSIPATENEGSNSKSSMVDPVQEMSDREYRKKNLIVFGAVEEKSENDDVKSEVDQNIIREIIETSGMKIDNKDVKISRIGRPAPGKIRPLKIRFNSAENVRQVISKAKEMKKKQNMSTLAFSYDRTPKQVQEYKIIKNELTNRMSEGEEGLKIKYIKGVPRIVKPKN